MDLELSCSQHDFDYLLKRKCEIHKKIMHSGTLLDLIRLYYEIRLEQCLLPQKLEDFCDSKQGQIAKKPPEKPTVGAMRHRLATELKNAGCTSEFSNPLCTPLGLLPTLADQFDRAVEILQHGLFEVEARLIDEPPINPKEAKTKARLLIEFLKEDEVFDPTLLAFSLEECFEML